MKNIAIFASGSGTNAENIIQYFKNKKIANIKLILSNKKDAYVIQRSEDHNIPVIVFNRDTLYNSDHILTILKELSVDLIVLAGFMWLMPKNILNAYPNKIINIHPALLPKFGGKGMYGMNVHRAVIHNKEKESGITIHFVNEIYDDGEIIFQAKCKIDAGDSPELLAAKIHQLEYEHFPKIIETLLSN